MKGFNRLAITLASAGFAALGLAADTIELQRNSVVPVKFDQELSIKKSHEGDRFTASVDKNRDLPPGTYFRGRIIKIDKKKNHESMQLNFDEVVLPDGTHAKMRGVPVKWEGKDRYDDKNGQIDARQGKDDGKAVFGGIAIGGVLGALIKKPFEGAFLGALAGVIINESNRSERGNLAIRKDDKMGVYIKDDVELSFDNRDNRDWAGDTRNEDDRWEEARRDREIERGRDGAPERLPANERDNGRVGTIRFGDQALKFDDRDTNPYYEHDTLMVPLESVARQLSLDLDESSRSSRIFISYRDHDLVLEHGSSSYRLNGKSKEMDEKVSERNGVVFVPAKVIGELLEKTVYIDNKKVSN